MCPKSHAQERTVLESGELEPSQRPGTGNKLPVKYYTAAKKQGVEDGRKLEESKNLMRIKRSP